ncbi:hypothetical protein [Paenibacillus silvae]|uniref:hypothetical protein n=1 Tax=Paenibacillus silvae TaxID=1325358 RepID=UPI0011B7667C|nr:hypothetical protein [Paenibacillus silvae]
MSITKGTASKTIAQLGSKGLISKFQREDKVHFQLTEIGHGTLPQRIEYSISRELRSFFFPVCTVLLLHARYAHDK